MQNRCCGRRFHPFSVAACRRDQTKAEEEKAQAMSEASRQCIHEFKALFHRWEQESDLEQEDILECLKDALDEYYKEDVVDFDSEIEIEEKEEEE